MSTTYIGVTGYMAYNQETAHLFSALTGIFNFKDPIVMSGSGNYLSYQCPIDKARIDRVVNAPVAMYLKTNPKLFSVTRTQEEHLHAVGVPYRHTQIHVEYNATHRLYKIHIPIIIENGEIDQKQKITVNRVLDFMRDLIQLELQELTTVTLDFNQKNYHDATSDTYIHYRPQAYAQYKHEWHHGKQPH